MNSPTVKGCGHSFAVIDINGKQIGRTHRTPDKAHDALDRILKGRRTKTRTCLCCSIEFPSEGYHNRMCNDCRKDPLHTDAKTARGRYA